MVFGFNLSFLIFILFCHNQFFFQAFPLTEDTSFFFLLLMVETCSSVIIISGGGWGGIVASGMVKVVTIQLDAFHITSENHLH